MKFKLDENFGTRTQHVFKVAGYDVQTVFQESLQGASDQRIYDVCCAEQRCLVTLDMDFANVTRFAPDRPGGIAVIRLPRNPSLSLLESLIRQLLHALDTITLDNKLWIVEPGRIRVHQSDEEAVF